MSEQTKEYEFARKIMRREKERHNPWTKNRKEAMVQRVQKDFGSKGLKEFTREFKKELGLK